MKTLLDNRYSRILSILLLMNLTTADNSFAALSGIYTINASAAASATNYKTFASAISDMASGTRADGGPVQGMGVSGAVTFNVAAGTYNEQVVIPGITGASAVNTITFDGGTGNAATRILQYDGSLNVSNYSVLTLYGSKYIRIKNLTIHQTSATANGWGICIYGSISGATNVADNNIIQDCIVNIPAGSGTNLFGIIAASSQVTPQGGQYINNTIDNCIVNNGFTGIALYGNNNNINTGNIISNNTITNSYNYGVRLFGATNCAFPIKIRNNTINTNSVASTTYRGIALTSIIPSTGDNIEITGNVISSFSYRGIEVAANVSNATQRLRIANNFIGGNISSTFAANVIAGIQIASSYVDIWFNSVYININVTNISGNGAFYTTSSLTGLDMRNNIFSYTSGTGLPFQYTNGSGFGGFTAFNNNIFYNASGGNVANIGGTSYTSATLKGAGGFNSNSLFGSPNFDNVAVTNYLHITSQCTGGAPVSVTTDIDGQTRANPPAIGADEISIGNMSGSYTIDKSVTGASNLFPYTRVFNNFSDAVTALNACGGITGAVTFNVAAGTYSERVVIPEITGASAVNTVTFDGGAGNAATRIVEYNSQSDGTYRAVMTLYGSKYIRIKNLTIHQTSTTADGWGICVYGDQSGTPKAENNTIQDCIVNMPVVSSVTFNNLFGIVVTGSTATATLAGQFNYILIDGCTINNGYAGLEMYSYSSLAGNVISNNTATDFYQFGLYIAGTGNNPIKVRNNKINTNSVSTGSRGIHLAAFPPSATDNIEVSGNVVSSFGAIGITTSANNGSSTQRLKVFNNFIGGNISSAFVAAAKGLACNSSYADIWFNSVNMNIALSSTTASAAFITTVAQTNLDVRNNIFAVTNASAVGLPYYYNIGGFTSYSSFDNNIFYSASGGNVATIGGTTYTSATLKGAGGFNSNSLFGSPNFDNVAATNYLHITSQCTGGAPVSVTADIDGQTRANPPTIGADEITLAPVPATPGTITGTPTVCQGQNGVAYSVSAVSGASSYSWTLPSGYNIIGATTNNSVTVNFSNTAASGIITVQGVNSCGTAGPASPNYSVTVNPLPDNPGAITGSVTVCRGTTVNYSISAVPNATSYSWTLPPNATISGSSTSRFVDIVFPANAASGTISVSGVNSCGNSLIPATLSVTVKTYMNGTYTIDNTVSGPSNLFPNTSVFNNFTDAVTELSCRGVSGAVTFNVAVGTYTEQVVIPEIPGASAANTITFDGGAGNAATRILQFDGSLNASNYAVLSLYGSKYIRVKNLTIHQTTATANGWGICIYGASSGTPIAENNTIQNCIVNMPVADATYNNRYSIVLAGSRTYAPTSGQFNNTLIDGCTVNNGTCGIFMYTSALYPVAGNVFSNNTINNAFLTGIQASGGGENPIKIRNNKITTNSTSTSNRGIYLISINPSATDNIEVSGNVVPSFGAIGIQVTNSSTSTQRLKLFNNFVGGNISSAFSGIAKGLACNCPYADIWFNSVNMNIPLSSATSSAAFIITAVTPVITGLDIRNNIFAVSDASSIGLPFYFAVGDLTRFNSFDNNIFYNAAGTNEARIGATTYTSATLNGAGGYNNNSYFSNPYYDNIAATNYLHLEWPCHRGVQITGITTDIDGQTRANPPNIGADERADRPIGSIGTISGNAQVCEGQSGVTYSVPAVSEAVSYNWTVPSGATIIGAATNRTITVDFAISASSGNIEVYGVNPCENSATATLSVTVNNLPVLNVTPPSANICSEDVVSTAVSGASTYTWTPATGLSSTTGSPVDVSPSASTTYTITGISLQGCSSTTTLPVTVRARPVVSVTPDNAVCLGGTDVTLTASGAVSYTWSPAQNLNTTVGPTVTAQISQLTFYTVTGTAANGCTDDAIVPVATVAVGGNVSPLYSIICSGGSKLLTVTGAAGNSYQWQSSANGLSGWSYISGATNTSYTAAPSSKTYYRLMAKSNACWDVASTTAVVDISNPSITVTVTGKTDNSLTLDWSPVGSGNYTIDYNGTTSGSASNTTPPYTQSGLAANGTYNITVTQTGVIGCAASGTLTGINTLCAMPDNVVASSPGNKKLKVDWEGAAGDYRVYYRPTHIQNGYQTKDVTTAGTSGTTTINVTYNTSYEVYVVSKDCPSSGQFGQPSALYYTIVGPSSPCTPAPTINYVKSTCAGQIEVSMSGSPTGKYTIAVQRLTPTVASMNLYSVTGSYFQVNVGSAGQTFLVAVASKCLTGTSDYVVYPGGITIKPLCKAIPNLVLSNPTCSGFTASWNRDECSENTVNTYQLFIRRTSPNPQLTWNSYVVASPSPPITPYKLVNWMNTGSNIQCYVRSNYVCNGYVIQGPPSTTESITTLSIGCREENESLIQPEEPAAVITSADNTEAISLYPNPNGGQFRIDISRLSNEKAEVRIEVINILGQTILTRISEAKDGFGNELITLPETVSAGTYFVRVTVGKNTYSMKVSVNK